MSIHYISCEKADKSECKTEDYCLNEYTGKYLYKLKKKNNFSINKNKHEGLISLMCPECYSILDVRLKTNYSISIDPDIPIHEKNYMCSEIDTDKLKLNVRYEPKFNIRRCPFCGAECVELLKIDYHLASDISCLNYFGFETEYCCESHNHKGSITMYIKFKDKKIMKYLDYLPESWEFDLEMFKYYDSCIIRVPCIYDSIEEYYEHKTEYLTELYEFIMMIMEDINRLSFQSV